MYGKYVLFADLPLAQSGPAGTSSTGYVRFSPVPCLSDTGRGPVLFPLTSQASRPTSRLSSHKPSCLPEVILILAPLGQRPRVLCLSDQTYMHTIAKSGHEGGGGDRGGPLSGIHFSSLGPNAFSRFEHCIRSSRNWSPLQELASYILPPWPSVPTAEKRPPHATGWPPMRSFT